MAGLISVGGAVRISIRSLFDGAEKSVSFGIPDGTQATWVRWVNDDHILIGLTALLPIESDKWYVSRVIALNRANGKITTLLWDQSGQNAADMVWVPSNGSNEVLIAAQGTVYSDFEQFWPTVYRVDVSNGKKRVVVKPHSGVMDWSADATGAVRTGVGYADSTRTSRLLYRKDVKSSFRVVDSASYRRDEDLTYPFMFIPGTDHAYVMRGDDKGKIGIYEYDLLNQREVKLFYAPEQGEVSSPIVSSDGTSLLGARTNAKKNSVHWFDPKLSELQAQFAKAVPNADVRIESFNADRSKMLVRVSAADMPGTLYFYDVEVGTLQRVAAINEAIGSKRLAPVKLVQYKARDGLEIEGVLTLPAGQDPKALPFIVMPHGGPWAHDGLYYDYWAQFLANRGYAVLQPNFRGSTGYGKAFVDKGKGQLGLAMQDDVTDGVKWAIAQGIADPKRLCIVGASYGGYAAMWGLVRDPDLYRCAISIAGVASLRKEVNDFGDKLRGGLYRDQWTAMTPDFAAVSPLGAAPRISKPLLLVHGKKDVTVDHDQSTKMYAAMQKAGKSVEFVSVPLADHYFTRQEDRLTLLSAMETFLAKHNPAN